MMRVLFEILTKQGGSVIETELEAVPRVGDVIRLDDEEVEGFAGSAVVTEVQWHPFWSRDVVVVCRNPREEGLTDGAGNAEPKG